MVKNLKKKLESKLQKIDLILDQLSRQRKELEENLQQVLARKFLIYTTNVDSSPNSTNDDSTRENEAAQKKVVLEDKQISSPLMTSFPYSKFQQHQILPTTMQDSLSTLNPSLNLIELNLDVPSSLRYGIEEEEEEQDDDVDEDDEVEGDSKQKLQKLFSKLQNL